MVKGLVYWMVAALVIFLFWSVSARIQKEEHHIVFSDFIEQVERGHVARVVILGNPSGSQIAGDFKNGQSFRTFAPPGAERVLETLLDRGVEVSARDGESRSWLGHIISWTPIVIMIAFLIFFMRSFQPAAAVRPTPAERRLQIKSRLLPALTTGEMSEAEMLGHLNDGIAPVTDERDLRTAVYEMLSDGVVVLTEEKKFRVRTVGASETRG